MTQKALELEGVSRHFGALAAVDDVYLAVAGDERHAVLGANGAGKTTLFNLISGDLQPTRGHIRFFGEEVTGLAAHERIRRGLRRTYQKTELFAALTVRQNLYLAARGVSAARPYAWRSGRREQGLQQTAETLAQSVGLAEVLTKQVGELAYGLQRQLEIGMALVGAPRFILFDEPAAGLSASERERLTALLQARPRGEGFLLIEHDLDVALQVAERVTIMHEGRILTQGTPEQIENDPQVQAIYLGEGHRPGHGDHEASGLGGRRP